MLFWSGKNDNQQKQKGLVEDKVEPMKMPWEFIQPSHGMYEYGRPQPRSGSDNVTNLQELRRKKLVGGVSSTRNEWSPNPIFLPR